MAKELRFSTMASIHSPHESPLASLQVVPTLKLELDVCFEGNSGNLLYSQSLALINGFFFQISISSLMMVNFLL